MLTGLCAAFLLVDALGKLLLLAPYVEGTRQVGYAVGVIRPLGVVLGALDAAAPASREHSWSARCC